MSNYELGEKIGQGGMGVVYRAHHLSLDRDVAVKFIHQHLADDEEAVERFLREARLAAKINHPNVVQIYDTGQDDSGRPYIVMELLEGESLRQRLKRGPIPLADAVRISLEILDALTKAHSQGIVHRDIKPGNIFICADGESKLLDFGIAKALGGGSLTGTGTLVGTPEYMSPEQAEGERVDARSDLYSLGIVLYEMVSGVAPFKADTPVSVLHMQVHKPAPPVPGQGSALSGVITRALAKNPADRPQTARQFAALLEAPPTAQAAASSTNNAPAQFTGPITQPIQQTSSSFPRPLPPSDRLPAASESRLVTPGRSHSAAIIASLVLLLLLVGGISAGVLSTQQHRAEQERYQAEQDRRAAEQQREQAAAAEQKAKEDADRAAEEQRQAEERRHAEEARHEEVVARKRANPWTLVASGVDDQEPKVDKYDSGHDFGRSPKVYVYAVLDNHLAGVEDQTIQWKMTIKPDFGEASELSRNSWTIYQSEGRAIIWASWALETVSKYAYTIEINGRDVAEGSFNILYQGPN